MKKLLSVVLSVIMAMSVLVIPATVSAKETKKVPNTYVANFDSVYNFSKGTISDDFWGPFSYYKKNSNKYVTIENTTPYDSDRTLGYYVRGNEIYYCFVETKYANFVYSIKTFNINNKKKKKFYEVTDKKVSSCQDVDQSLTDCRHKRLSLQLQDSDLIGPAIRSPHKVPRCRRQFTLNKGIP